MKISFDDPLKFKFTEPFNRCVYLAEVALLCIDELCKQHGVDRTTWNMLDMALPYLMNEADKIDQYPSPPKEDTAKTLLENPFFEFYLKSSLPELRSRVLIVNHTAVNSHHLDDQYRRLQERLRRN